MCIVFFSFQSDPDWPVFIAANRDEFYARPTLPADYWPDAPDILGGIDQQTGGTWLAVSKQAQFGFITNYRDPSEKHEHAPSRGHLVAQFLRQTVEPEIYLQDLSVRGHLYNGFNLVLGNPQKLYYYSNKLPKVQPIRPGVHVISNHLLDTPWPKSVRLRQAFEPFQIDRLRTTEGQEQAFDLLHDEHKAADAELPQTGISLAMERLLSSPFIQSPLYGTRSSTLLAIHKSGEIIFKEKSYP